MSCRWFLHISIAVTKKNVSLGSLMTNVWPSIASIMSTKIELTGPPVNIKFFTISTSLHEDLRCTGNTNCYHSHLIYIKSSFQALTFHILNVVWLSFINCFDSHPFSCFFSFFSFFLAFVFYSLSLSFLSFLLSCFSSLHCWDMIIPSDCQALSIELLSHISDANWSLIVDAYKDVLMALTDLQVLDVWWSWTFSTQPFKW